MGHGEHAEEVHLPAAPGEDCGARMSGAFVQGIGIGAVGGGLLEVVFGPTEAYNWRAVSRRAVRSAPVVGGTLLAISAGTCMSESLTGKKDWKNAAFGGLTGGLAVGIATKSGRAGMGSGALMALVCGLVALSDGKFSQRKASDWGTALGYGDPAKYEYDVYVKPDKWGLPDESGK
eukprot:PLAT15784.1.p1 GENE.PLAT15784.1~~PLAT15784.1.p1  ORF type:complete len:176 (+),score=53.45 PLAT15784.1:35-562(+)